MHRAAILDDYQNCALELADWTRLDGDVEITVFNDHIHDEDGVAARLKDFDIIVMNRERTPMPKSQLEKLPNLKLLVTSGMHNLSIDFAGAQDLGIIVCGTQMVSHPTPELAWALIMSIARQIPEADRSVRNGGWQNTVGIDLKGATLGVIGLGRLGVPISAMGNFFGMKVIAWSPNLTPERTAEHDVECVAKDDLLARSDFITIHMPMSERSRNIFDADDFAKMKSSAYLINTSRGPLVNEAALIDALETNKIAGAALDVYDIEPLPADHSLRRLENTVLTPHLGFVSKENYQLSFGQAVEDIEAWVKGAPIRLMEPH